MYSLANLRVVSDILYDQLYELLQWVPFPTFFLSGSPTIFVQTPAAAAEGADAVLVLCWAV